MMSRLFFFVVLAVYAHGVSHAQPVPVFKIDPVETHARFEVKFLGVITVRGKFHRTTGTLLHDPERHDAASRANDAIHAEIDATTLDAHVMNADATNEILRGPQFFNVEKFPSISFKSSRFNWEDTTLKSIDGALTLLGVRKNVTLTIEKSGCSPASAGKRARCTADAFVKIQRADFGMKAWSASVSNDVKIIVELVAHATPDTNETLPEAKPDVKKPDDPNTPMSNPPTVDR
jgi:polyisoprenoid-binding protein YceI